MLRISVKNSRNILLLNDLLVHNHKVITPNFRRLSSSASAVRPRRVLLYSIIGGIGVGAGYSYLSSRKTPFKAILNPSDGDSIVVLKEFPNVEISRKITYATDSSGLDITLFQYPTCPFCCKVRAYLDAMGVSYKVVEVNPVLRQQLGWTNYRKVPIVLVKTDDGYLQLNDSSMIISTLYSFMYEGQSTLREVAKCYPTISFQSADGEVKKEILNRYFLMFKGSFPRGLSKEDIESERKWRKWADDDLVHMLSPNVYRTTEEALESFHWFSEVGEWERLFPAWETALVVYVGAFAMWIIGKRLKKRHHLKTDVRESLYDSCEKWSKELKNRGGVFHGGKEPNLADLAVYGVLTSIEGCRAFGDVLANTKIGPWYAAMRKHIKRHDSIPSAA